MEPHVRATLTDLCNVFDVITRKPITVKKLGRLQEEIVTIICEMEMYFPPALFDIMVHLLVHIVDDIEDLGPAFLHNMMALERMNAFIKGYVRQQLAGGNSMPIKMIGEQDFGGPAHLNEVEPWVDQHINMIKSRADKPMTEEEVFRAHNSSFASWFKDQIDANPPPMASA
ncbi:hypothetical protein QYE76_007978 [Lolium multiflorum]|uniref:DUF4218 domain-containing protein n=1 Tax=Lolium multiflorum TaxID=4521 RepID=A0AAD8PHZ7_LOLMU|nr:hypothetical protein QYE76_007978 [Lolium multiflorum]